MTALLVALLGLAAVAAPAPAPDRTPAPGPARPLEADELERLRADVLARCGLEADADGAPWYFHYELGLELARRGDHARAVEALLEATDRRPGSRRQARMYGMWFTRYAPYFHLARSQAELGRLECAAEALALSERMGEVERGDEEYPELEALRAACGAGGAEPERPSR